jgi:hypothetical protein
MNRQSPSANQLMRLHLIMCCGINADVVGQRLRQAGFLAYGVIFFGMMFWAFARTYYLLTSIVVGCARGSVPCCECLPLFPDPCAVEWQLDHRWYVPTATLRGVLPMTT